MCRPLAPFIDAKLLIFASGMAGMEKIALNEWLLSG